MQAKIQAIAQALRQASSLIIATGAGMGVDSGLPDFRGPQGFWQAYPQYEALGLNFMDCANPERFKEDPAFAWGFYGHRLQLYRETQPHEGFHLLRSGAQRLGLELFHVTSNVDGQLQKAGFPPAGIWEIHGSIHYLQCLHGCSPQIWQQEAQVGVDPVSMRAHNLPPCPHCQGLARPNILMFGDWEWDASRSHVQEIAFWRFVNQRQQRPGVILEIGAGTQVPSIRHLTQQLAAQGWHLIRINPREPHVQAPHQGLAMGALAAMQAIHQAL